MATDRAYYPDESMKAASDLSAKQFYILELTAEDTVDVTNSAADLPYGVLQNAPKSGETAEVRTGVGITKVVSDGNAAAIAVGDRVGTNNAGKAVKKTAADDFILGIALSASAADGTVISVQLVPAGTQRSS